MLPKLGIRPLITIRMGAEDFVESEVTELAKNNHAARHSTDGPQGFNV